MTPPWRGIHQLAGIEPVTNFHWVLDLAGEQPSSHSGTAEAGSAERLVHAQEEGGPPLQDLHLHRLHVRQLSQVRIPAGFPLNKV